MTAPAPALEIAPAKVNLFLRVVGRRADGYHLLDSLAVFAAAADRLEASPAGTLSLAIDGPGAAPLLAEDANGNLVLRAARALAEAMTREDGGGNAGILGARLRLTKMLPVASGIGGGSADAAAALRALSRLWGRPVPAGLAERLATSLGADVPVCMQVRPARMAGIGERVLPSPALPAYGLLLANPGVAVSTPAVFRARDAQFSAPAALPHGWGDAASMAADLAALGNDLEAPARLLCPPIAEVLAALRALPGCLLARMSGSGATCFALFATPAAARRAAAALRRPPQWWVWAGGPHAAAPAAQTAPEIVAVA